MKSTKKLNKRQKKYKEVVKQRAVTKGPPVLYTKRLKSKKNKKIKFVGRENSKSDIFNQPPVGDDDFVPASFKEMMFLKNAKPGSLKSKLHPDIGDTKGMKKQDTPNPLPKQGKYESDAHYIGRVHKQVEDELAKVAFSKKQKAQMVTTEIKKSKKKRKAVKRLNEKRKMKRLYAAEKHETGFERFQDPVKFNEVVQTPPIHLTKPKKVGGKKLDRVHMLDKLLTV